jgi:hypothetical protein
MYKSRFKRWNFTKYRRGRDVTNKRRHQGSHRSIDKTTALERNENPGTNNKDSSGYHHKDLSASVVCPSSPSTILTSITSLNSLDLQELIHIHCSNNYPSAPQHPPQTVYNILSDLTLAHVSFSQKENKLGGAFCERAFQSIHILASPTSKLDIFVFLVGNLVWSNSDLTRIAWSYLTAYSATAPGSVLQRIFRGFNQYIRDYSFQAYLDFVADQLVDAFLKHGIMNIDFVVRGFLSLGVIPFFRGQFKEVIGGMPEDHQLSRFSKRVSLQLVAQRTFIEPERLSSASTLTSATSRAWHKLLELRLLDGLADGGQDDVLRCATELMEISPSCGNLWLFFEGAALAVLAMFYKAKWDEKRIPGDLRHELARLYLEKSIGASANCSVQVDGAFLRKLVILEQWQREAGCVEQAAVTYRRAREWVREQSLLMGCEAVED